MKSHRQQLILGIISAKDIETQEELAAELKKKGYDVTQATISRDIKELRLVKVLSGAGGYKYAQASGSGKSDSDRFIRIFSESVLSIAASGNLIVIHTLPGSANAAGEAVDSLKWPEILGTLAGDNTLLVVVQSEDAVGSVLERFSTMTRRHLEA